jgi:tetratricopeptide (TPR) repeat protein
LLLSLASAVVTINAQKTADAVGSLSRWSFGYRFGNAVHSYAMYVWKTFVPHGLAPFYLLMILQGWEVLLALAFLVSVGCLVYRLGLRRPYAVMGSFFFLGTLIPVIGLIQVGSQSMADRYFYIPGMGLFIAVVWGVADIVKSVKLNRPWIVTTATFVLITLSFVTTRQQRFWRSSYDLWTHTLEVTVNNFVAEENLAQNLRVLGRDDEALIHFLNAAQINPDNASMRLNAGEALLRHSRYLEATVHFSAVIRLTGDYPHLSRAYDGLGVATAWSGDRTRARQYFLQALRFAPDDPRILYNFSLVQSER